MSRNSNKNDYQADEIYMACCPEGLEFLPCMPGYEEPQACTRVPKNEILRVIRTIPMDTHTMIEFYNTYRQKIMLEKKTADKYLERIHSRRK